MYQDVSRSSLGRHEQKCKHLMNSQKMQTSYEFTKNANILWIHINSICHICNLLKECSHKKKNAEHYGTGELRQLILHNAIARHVKRVKHFTLQDVCSVCSVNLAITPQGVSKNTGHHRITIGDMCLEAGYGTVGKHNLHTMQNYIVIHRYTSCSWMHTIWLTLVAKVPPARHCKVVL